MDNTPLEDFFNDDEPEATVAEPVAEAPQAEAQPRDETGKFAAKTTGVEADEPQSEPPSDKLPPETFKGLKEEREKRQNLERELEALRQQIQAVQQPQEPPAPPPTIWEDEQGWQQHFGNAVTAQASMNARLDMSEMLASQNHDFDEMKAKFVEMMSQNPALQQQALQAKHPWEKAYQIAKNAKTMEELGATDLDTLKAKLREELLAEAQVQVPVTAGLPPSLTSARNVGARTGPAWSGPKSLDELLGG
jgi:hypothetical protein